MRAVAVLRLRTAQYHGDFAPFWEARLRLMAQTRHQLSAAKAIVVLGSPLESVFYRCMHQRGQSSSPLLSSILALATRSAIALQ